MTSREHAHFGTVKWCMFTKYLHPGQLPVMRAPRVRHNTSAAVIKTQARFGGQCVTC